jgi:hypothetical protein
VVFVLSVANSNLRSSKKTKLELSWIGKEHRPRLEPRILLEEPGQIDLFLVKQPERIAP